MLPIQTLSTTEHPNGFKGDDFLKMWLLYSRDMDTTWFSPAFESIVEGLFDEGDPLDLDEGAICFATEESPAAL